MNALNQSHNFIDRIRHFATSPQFCIFLVVAVLYGLAFNPYVPPQSGDDVTYFQGALSIAAGNGFKEQGKWIADWPPIQSCFLAIAMLVTGIREYYLSKILNGIGLLISLLLAHRLMVSEQRLRPTLSCILIAIFPTSLIIGSAGQADFTYFALSMIFFLLVAWLRQNRSILLAILCGIILGGVSLTRWQGVLLGASLVFQFVEVALKSGPISWWLRIRSGCPELVASVIGASIFLSWERWLSICDQNGTAGPSNYDYHGSGIWSLPNPIQESAAILNLLTQLENVVLTLAPSLSIALVVMVVVFFGVSLWGFALRIRQHGWLATDAFFVAMFLLLASYAYKESRYIIPMAPFFLDYLFRGLNAVHSRIHQSMRRSQASFVMQQRLFFAIWIAGLMTFDAILLFYGDRESVGPSCNWMLADNRAYLRGYHVDLYDICTELPSKYPNAIVASDKFNKQMIRHYSGLEAHFVEYVPDAKYTVFIQVDPACLPKRTNDLTKSEFDFPPSLEGRLSNPRKRGYITLWDVATTAVDDGAKVKETGR